MSIEKEIRNKLSEANVNMKKLDQLVRQGLMSPAQLPMLHRGLAKLQAGKTMNPQERDAVNKVVQSMMFIVTGDDTVFQKAKQHTQKNRYQTEDTEQLDEYGNYSVGIKGEGGTTVKARSDKEASQKAFKNMGIADRMRKKMPHTVKKVGEETMSEESPAEDNLSSSYKAKFAAMLKKTGKSLKDMSDDEKKAFFTKVDGAHSAKNEEVIYESEIAKSAAKMVALHVDRQTGESGNGPIKKAHAANVKKHGQKVADAIHKNGEHEGNYNAGSIGHPDSHKIHKDFVNKHLGGHNSAAHKAYHAHHEKNYTSSMSEGVNEGAMSRIDYQQKSGEKGTGLKTFKKKPAAKDTMVASPKTQRVKMTTAKAAERMVKKGAVYAEDAVNEEDKTHIVQYHTKDGTHKNDSRVMTKAKADDHAKRGNMIDKVGGKYTVKTANEETVDEGYGDSEDMRAKAARKAARIARKVASREKATDPGIKEDARSDARRAMRSDSKGMAPLKKDKKTTHTGTKAGEERHGGHIVMQLRKAVSIGKPVKFKDGKEHKVSKADAHKFMTKYQSSKPADREKMHSGHDSHDTFQSHINNK